MHFLLHILGLLFRKDQEKRAEGAYVVGLVAVLSVSLAVFMLVTGGLVQLANFAANVIAQDGQYSQKHKWPESLSMLVGGVGFLLVALRRPRPRRTVVGFNRDTGEEIIFTEHPQHPWVRWLVAGWGILSLFWGTVFLITRP